MIESISKLLNIPELNKEKLEGKEYGQTKINFTKNYGSLSNYSIPWKQLNLKQISYNDIAEEVLNLNDTVYVLMDSSKNPIYKYPKEKLNQLFDKDLKPYDVDIYVFDESFGKCIIYTGLFDKSIYATIPPLSEE